MTTRTWSFLPVDLDYVPPPDRVLNAIGWLRAAMPAYSIEPIDHGKVAFFDCGGNMGATLCPNCSTELSAKDWADWMTHDYNETTGFRFRSRKLLCCAVTITLDKIVFETPCMFARFGIVVTDTMKTYSEAEMRAFAVELSTYLCCSIRFLEAHY